MSSACQSVKTSLISLRIQSTAGLIREWKLGWSAPPVRGEFILRRVRHCQSRKIFIKILSRKTIIFVHPCRESTPFASPHNIGEGHCRKNVGGPPQSGPTSGGMGSAAGGRPRTCIMSLWTRRNSVSEMDNRWMRVNSSSSSAEAFDRGGRDVSEREPVSAGGAASICRPDNESSSDSIGADGCKLMADGDSGARITVCGSHFWAGVTQPWPWVVAPTVFETVRTIRWSLPSGMVDGSSWTSFCRLSLKKIQTIPGTRGCLNNGWTPEDEAWPS